jgi:transporter family-2 protein
MRAEVALGSGAAFSVGALTAGQSRVNGELALATGNGVQAAVVSMLGSFLLASIIILAVPRLRRGLREVGVALRSRRLRWWQLLGGIAAAIFLATQALTVPLLGVAIFTVALIGGQLLNSILVDRWGLGPAGRQPVTFARVISALLALVAVVIAVAGRDTGISNVVLVPAILAFIAGTGMAVQQALNGHVALASRDAMAASWINFTVGLTCLMVVFMGLWWGSDVDPGALPWDRWYLFSGGIVGVLFIATAAWVVQRVGILYFALLTIVGQLVGAALVDLIAPSGTRVTPALIVGIVVAGLAVLVGALPRISASRR